MNTKTTIAALMLSMGVTAQTITNSDGYSINITDYEVVEIIRVANKTRDVLVIGDGYDEIIISDGSEITDRKRVITDRALDFSNKNGFWNAFMKRCGFMLEDTKTRAKKKNMITKLLPVSNKKETTLTFIKKQ
tara:strand:+ start:314 stop:712 length:399 start_codon:yes stop_codon:yes gene_type:complete